MYGRRWRQRQGVDIAERFRLPCNAERRAPSAVTAPRAREQRRPPWPPDRQPPCRGGRPCLKTCSASGRPAGFAWRPAAGSSAPLAAAALLALSGALALPATAEAQTATALVSNIGQGSTGTSNSPRARSQRFTTGSNASGYVLSSVDVVSADPASSDTFSTKVCSVNASGYPTSSCTDLTPPDRFTSGRLSFTAPDNTTLESMATYAVVMSVTAASVLFSVTSADGEDSEYGWGIADSYDFHDGSAWGTTTSGNSHRIAIKGFALLDAEPPNLTARAVAPMQVRLDWNRTLPALKTIDRDVGYRIEGSPDGTTSWTSLVNYTNQDGTFDLWCTCYPTKFNDDTIEPGETRYYRIQAVDDDKASVYSNVVSATTPGLVDSDGGLIEFGAVESQLNALNDQKVFRIRLESGEYRFTISGVAPKHRVVVTDAGGTEIENLVLESNNNLVPRITAQSTGQHQVNISHGGGFGNAGSGSLQAGSFQFQLLPVREDAAATLRLPGTPSLSPILNTYGDLDSWGVAVQPGKAYAVRVWGRETNNRGTAATPRIKRARPPSTTHVYDMGKPWVDGVTIAKRSPICHSFAEPEKCEYQAFVIDLRGQTGAEQTWRIDVATTARPRTRPYRVGSYEVDLRELSSSELQGVRMPLRAWFASQPAQHDGSKRIKVRVGFSDAVAESPEHGVKVEGGEVTSVRPVDGNAPGGAAAAPATTRSVGGQDGEVVWEFEIEPDSDGDVTVSLEAWRPCEETGAICTADGRLLSQGISTTVRGSGDGPAPNTPAAGVPTIGGAPRVGEELTASTSEISDADGLDDASFAYQWIRTDTDIEGATGSTYTVVDADEAETLKVRVDFTDAAGNEESLTSAATDVVAAAPDLLTASFENVPSEHDGETAFRLRVAFSEPIKIRLPALRDDAFTVTGGRVTGVGRVDRRNDLFQIEVEPVGDGDVTIELPGGRECRVSGAICGRGKNPRRLSNTPTARVAGPSDDGPEPNTPATGAPAIGGMPRVGDELTVSTSDISDADGLDDARFAYQWIRADSDIRGATGSTYTAVDADEGERLKVRVGFTDDAGNAESLTSAATDAVAARPVPLTASFEGMPAEHRGEGGFDFRVAFSEDIGISFKALREDAFALTGGRVTGGKRVDGRRDLFRMTVRPDSDAAVTITLPAGRECGVSGAICTKGENRRQLTNSPSARVRGPVGISVADARVEEDDGAVLVFLVTLSRAAGGTLAVDYATSDGSAHAGVDYTAASGRLSFRTGESSKKIAVGVLDDAHDEGEETLTLTLSNASGGRLTDGDATGTIENRDPLPRALLARFGRTAAVHVVEHVEERLQAPREPGFRGRFAGRELRRGMERDMALNFLNQLGSASGVHPAGMAGHGAMAGPRAAGAAPLGMPGRGGGGALMTGAGGPMSGAVGMAGGGASLHAPGLGATGFGGAAPMGAGPAGGPPGPAGGLNDGGFLQMGLGGGDLLTGSDFAMNRESHGGILSFWSRGAQSRFSGREGALSLGGDVRTTMFGADYARGPVVAGLSLSNSRGLGHYAGAAGGQVASSVTGLYPWLGYKATERVTVWGVAGYGTGGLLLTPDGGQALESGLSMAMAAAGTRGELLAGGASGFGLAFKADALWVGTAIDGVDGPAGRLKATDAAVTRFRTGLEGSRAYTLAGRLSLTPSLEVGLRHDGGDAETGAGMDVGAGLIVSDTGTGLAVDVRVRTLLVHQDEDFSERGVSLSLSYNPTPSSPLGFVARVAPSWGGQATSGAQALWGRETMGGMAHGGVAQGNRLDGEVGYGLPVGSRFVGTPRVGFSTSEYGQDYRVGYGLGVLDRESMNFELGVEAQRRNSPVLGGTSNGMLGRATLGW